MSQSSGEPEGFSPGPNDTYICTRCGALVPRRNAGSSAVDLHRSWHDQLEQRLASQPGSEGGDNGGG